jgi:hypothetical protein
LIVVVVLPTPPFWLHIAMIRAFPCDSRGAGSGITGIGRPVGPIGRLAATGSFTGRASAKAAASISTAGTCGAS